MPRQRSAAVVPLARMASSELSNGTRPATEAEKPGGAGRVADA